MHHILATALIICAFIAKHETAENAGIGKIKIAENAFIAKLSTVEEEVLNKLKKDADGGCVCEGYSCGCCAHLEEPEIELNSTICANVTYLVHDYGISFTITVNHYTIFNETVSARNPPPVCIGIPYVKDLATACIRLYDIDATTVHLHACAKLEARMKTILVAKYELGCFSVGPPGITNNISPHGKTTENIEKAPPPPKNGISFLGFTLTISSLVIIFSCACACLVKKRSGGASGSRLSESSKLLQNVVTT